MKNKFNLLLVILICLNCGKPSSDSSSQLQNNTASNSTNDQPKFAIVIHGGAGTILKENITSEKEAAYKADLEKAIRAGHSLLKNGGTSLDAVELSIKILEDSPLFNAGKGAVFTNNETNELDASIMDGQSLNAGASAGTTTVKNPIGLARKIMDSSAHVLLYGNGAETFAKEQGLELVAPDYFYTESRMQSLKRVKAAEAKVEINKTSFYDYDIKSNKFGTVGCVALDLNGNLAAGTSTGGMTNKRFGRIGDVPIIGAGTYANNATCAVSGTGWGEYFIRATVAHDISALMEYKGLSLAEASKEVIQRKVPDLGGNGGIIAIDKDGQMHIEFNTAGMFRASMNAKGELMLGMYKK